MAYFGKSKQMVKEHHYCSTSTEEFEAKVSLRRMSNQIRWILQGSQSRLPDGQENALMPDGRIVGGASAGMSALGELTDSK